MSVQAISWVLEQAEACPPHMVGTLVGLANHADADGTGAFPSVVTLAKYAKKSPRSVQSDLRALEGIGLIRQGDPRRTYHLPPDRRPVVYDLAIDGVKPAAPRGDDGVKPSVERGEVQRRNGVKCASPKPSTKPREEPLTDTTAAPVVAAWVEAATKKTGSRPAGSLIARVGKQAKELLAEGKDADELTRAATSAGSRGYTDLALELLRMPPLVPFEYTSWSSGD